LQKYRFATDIKGRIYKSIAGGIILKKEDTKFALNTGAINKSRYKTDQV
jgi:glycerol-3-phosphate responsive antiterminator